MKTQAKKWGNSLAVRIPKIIAEEAGVYEGGDLDISSEGRRIIVAVMEPRAEYSLEQLMAQVSDENLHGETDTGEAVGGELL